MPGREELPDTIRRSESKAQRTWIKAHDSAVREYGEGERAHRVAYGALKHTYEKVGDHWERKEGGRKGPSDERSRRPRGSGGESAQGVDTGASKEHLYDVAKRLGVEGRSRMSKSELVDAIRKANDRSTERARR
ncbi:MULTISPECIES: ChaB family protein [Streptomycetaceae]|uniref:ChaB family protein n=1 Tax=Streptantibioticus cattleyicolor (strain ATCC 35852 / DSM 46488 / JCM 4925 / NBRC 14057 / NRRL 8057) TaxID=1003195 RepID=F8JRS1_STREN|nr:MULTISPECIES: ChaB family protein [Streptomycetaceae]AEW97249.1 ChaB family protein [Streptantibioticus cattleyicolor NRRL 8057 = DSM 46488]MYS61703.1 cation transport regulator ChaB [Streptomyces sp. SID5468]CCB77571.1 ChaB family protein [Streptantibioticus cattleyicolor NRRL 8057 = DSM 46488]